MTRKVTYITDVPSGANEHVRMSRSMLLMMSMLRAGHNPKISSGCGLDSRIQIDYAMESPDEIPAGACRQYESEVDTFDDGSLPEQAVMAEQMTIRRDD